MSFSQFLSLFFLIEKNLTLWQISVWFDTEEKQISFQIPFQIMQMFIEDNIWFPHVSDCYCDEAFSMVSLPITQD